MRTQWSWLPFALALLTSAPANAQNVRASTHADGCSTGPQPCYNLTDVQSGPDLGIYTSTMEAGQLDGFWSRCSTSVSFGRVRTSVAQAGFGVPWLGAATCSANGGFYDLVAASAPDLAFGTPMTYTAKATLSTSTPGTQAPYHQISLCITLAGQTACSDHSGTVAVRVKTTVGSVMPLVFQVDSAVRADMEVPVMTVGIDKLARLKLSSNKAGANITGQSGYTYK
ncbi:MAG: hypothetical protein J0M20_11420 [Burkholderiales bacterium]|nr:hypothetical protein [Burkholderiales bacterium]